MTEPALTLSHWLGELNASSSQLQVSHRRSAIEYTFEALDRTHRDTAAVLGEDEFGREMNDTMNAWAKEELLQGSYMREYHLWEKDCAEYFVKQAGKCDSSITMKARGGQSFIDVVLKAISRFGVSVPDAVMDTIGTMRNNVNTMKHAPGLVTEHFITAGEHEAAMVAIETFWKTLSENEIYQMPRKV
ncbi:hypothetical protein [Bosea sp. (in: a-proteobacteria)]|uniref:hypothetical protein n=1 Tax=Bosea sp. (in: a-proteobacteria) TaxID=1871050 RepID=UPI0025B97B9D|nr:hypothetical protein [Bosea sp. (in: a-proteobacteria)]